MAEQNDAREERQEEPELTEREQNVAMALARRIAEESRINTHYYVKIGVSAFLCEKTNYHRRVLKRIMSQ
ncbi:MAG: hypothetical protein HFJ65_08095 [Eggerthellaceae bacterium]|nr:hypothetical protein [Eggerthellaceae bacterium]